MNEPDAYALEESLRLREKHGGEVVVCSAGPARVQQVIREALARGADRAMHVEDDALGAADAFTAAAALAAAMAEQKFDLILTGLQTDDQGHAQFGPVLAEKLGDAALDDHHGSERRSGSSLRVKRELEGGWFQYVDHAAAGAADDSERHQSAALRDAEGHHGGEEERDHQGGGARRGVASRQKIVALYAPQKPSRP